MRLRPTQGSTHRPPSRSRLRVLGRSVGASACSSRTSSSQGCNCLDARPQTCVQNPLQAWMSNFDSQHPFGHHILRSLITHRVRLHGSKRGERQRGQSGSSPTERTTGQENDHQDENENGDGEVRKPDSVPAMSGRYAIGDELRVTTGSGRDWDLPEELLGQIDIGLRIR